ncbi:MAG: hypothetical protein ACREO4_06270 [Lysobacter sp.]
MNSVSAANMQSHAAAVPESPIVTQLEDLARAQNHSFDLLNQVEEKLLVSQQGTGTLKGDASAPEYSTELRNRIQSRHLAAIGLNQRLMDLLERI